MPLVQRHMLCNCWVIYFSFLVFLFIAIFLQDPPVPYEAFMNTKNGPRLRPEMRGVRGPYTTAGKKTRWGERWEACWCVDLFQRDCFSSQRLLWRLSHASDRPQLWNFKDGGRPPGPQCDKAAAILGKKCSSLLSLTFALCPFDPLQESVDLSPRKHQRTATGTKLQYLQPQKTKNRSAPPFRRKKRTPGSASGASSQRTSSAQVTICVGWWRHDLSGCWLTTMIGCLIWLALTYWPINEREIENNR